MSRGVVSSSLCYRILRCPYQVLVSPIDLDPTAVFVPAAYFFNTLNIASLGRDILFILSGLQMMMMVLMLHVYPFYFRVRPPFLRAKSYHNNDVSRSAPAPMDQDTEITPSVFDWLPFRGRKSRACSDRSDLSPPAVQPLSNSISPSAPVEGTSPRRKSCL